MVGVKKKRSRNKSAWFIRSSYYPNSKWGVIPINWKGTSALFLLIGINVLGANYFRFTNTTLDSFLKFGVVFFLSLFIFIELAKHKTEGTHPKF